MNAEGKLSGSQTENLELDKITQEKLSNTDQLLTVIPVKRTSAVEFDRVLLLKVNNVIKSVVFKMYSDGSEITSPFSGKILIYDLEGNFINGFGLKNGIAVLKYKQKNSGRTANSKSLRMGGELEGVTVYNNYKGFISEIADFGWGDYHSGGDAGNGDFDWMYEGGGGSGGETPPVDEENPCDKMKAQMINANFLAKQEELEKKTNLKVETGYMQSKNGPFTPLTGTSSTDNADKISFLPDANTVGYMHTHVDPYDKEKPNGETESVEPIKMFSPADVKQFVILLLNASRYNIPVDNIYGTMVSSSATYQLRFTGNIADVSLKGNSINWEGLNDLYKVAMRGNKELGFLKFLNEQIGINGIELYKIEASGNSRKTLDNNGKVSTINCN
ncbi:MAG: hypothetical protein ABI441_01140 [Flavobacterium sp.]